MGHLGFVHNRNTENIGDLTCGPEDYFQFGEWENVHLPVEETWGGLRLPVRCRHYILGGGGLFFNWNRDHLYRYCKDFQSIIIWGAGLNDDNPNVRSDAYPQWLKGATKLVGVRDYIGGLRWVPCPSCMSPAFDKKREIKRDFVIYEHPGKEIRFKSDIPRVSGDKPPTLEHALDYLGEAETILTSSYHGAYWGTLLGRKVIMWSWSSKFLFMKHQQQLFDIRDSVKSWRVSALTKKAQLYPDALAECRQANVEFHKDVMEIVGEKWTTRLRPRNLGRKR